VSAGRPESFAVAGDCDHCILTMNARHSQAQWLWVCLENLKAGGRDYKKEKATHEPCKAPPLGVALSLAGCFWPAPWNK